MQPLFKASCCRPSKYVHRAAHYTLRHAIQNPRHTIVLIANAEVERQIASHLPVVLEEHTELILFRSDVARLTRFRGWIAPARCGFVIDKIELADL